MIGKGATPSFFDIANYNYTLTKNQYLPTVDTIHQKDYYSLKDGIDIN